MKKIISAFMAAAMALTLAVTAAAAEVEIKTETLTQATLGTLNSSGATYEGKIIIRDYVGRLETRLMIDGKETDASVAVIMPEKKGSLEVELTKFDAHIYNAAIQVDKFDYVPGKGFEKADEQAGRGSSDSKGGKVDLGRAGGLYSGRIHFYYSLENLKYKNIDDIPDEVWSELFWFNLGSPYVLLMTEEDMNEFLQTGELYGYTWPGLRALLTGEEDLDAYSEGSFENFATVDSYSKGIFSDVESQWFAPYVERVYECGLMKGNEDYTFSPEGNMTVAEAIALASRIHNIYYGKNGEFVQGEPWYEVYVGYAIERGMITKSSFEDYERNITRREMAMLLAASVDLSQLEKVNNFAEIPDMAKNDRAFEAVLALYNGGVLTGSEADGSFLPNDDITRCEVSAIAARLVDSSLRVVA